MSVVTNKYNKSNCWYGIGCATTMIAILFLLMLWTVENHSQIQKNPTEIITVKDKSVTGDFVSGHYYLVETDKGSCLAGNGGWAYPKLIIGHTYKIEYVNYNGYMYIQTLEEMK